MSSPVFFLAVSLASGILISSFFSFPFQSSLFLLLASLLLAWIFFLFRKYRLSFGLILLTTVFLGSNYFTLHQNSFENNPLRKLEIKGYADFYGKLYKSPSLGQDKDYLFLKVNKVSYQNREMKIKGNLRVTIPRTSELPKAKYLFTNDKIKISARLLSDKGYRNFKDDSLMNYLKTQKIHKRAYSKSHLLIEKLQDGKRYSPFRFISVLRQRLQKKIEEYFPSSFPGSISSQGAVLEALLLGARGRMGSATNTALQKAGLYHLIAISGAHIAIISFLLFSVFKLLRFPTRFNYLLLMVFLIFYAALVETRPSVLRATIMTLAFLLGKLIWRDVKLLNTIAISAFFLLLLNPFSLFDLGFQLTFAATLSIILFFPRIINLLPTLPLKISEIMALSLTAQLGVLPFIAGSFNRVTFSSLILNYAALPLVGVIMACGYIFLFVSFVSKFLAVSLFKIINFLISVFLDTSLLPEYLSFLSYRIPGPHPIIIIGYFLFLLLLLFPSKVKRQKLIFILCFLFFFVLLITYPFPSRSSHLKLTFIDVGQGDSVLVEFPGSKKMLIDGGGIPGDSFDIGERVVSPFLWSKGIKKIHYLILTHAHPDHLNGLRAVARNFRIGEFWEAFSPLENETYSEFKESLSPKISQKRVFFGHLFKEGEVRIEVLNPEPADPFVKTVDNDQSLVLRMAYGQTSFFLASDIGQGTERRIVDKGETIKSQLLKSPHHGSNSSSSLDLLDKVAPQIIVISVGEGNRYGHPDQNVIERYQKIGAKILRTDLHGAIEVSSNGQRLFFRIAESSDD